jgi:hypothetical protein
MLAGKTLCWLRWLTMFASKNLLFLVPCRCWFNPYLVGGIPTPLKNMRVSWDYDIPNINGKS